MDLLKQYFYDLRNKVNNYELEDSVVLDSVGDAAITAAFTDIENRTKGIKTILKDFIETNYQNKKFVVNVRDTDGEVKKFKFSYYSRFPDEIYQITTRLPYEDMAFLAQRLIVALANLDEIIDGGRITPVLRGEAGTKHEKEYFIYSKKQITDNRTGTFNALVEVKITEDKKHIGIYKINIEGSRTYNRRIHKIILSLIREKHKLMLKFYLS